MFALLLAACTGADEDVAPTLLQVDPSSGPSDSATDIMLRGTFPPVVQVSFADGKRTKIDVSYLILIGESELTDAFWIDRHSIAATIPAGMPIAAYDVSVIGPSKRSSTLEAAFRITDGQTCSDGTACGDVCRSTNACVAGQCQLGLVDKDTDGDGFIDAFCSGGDDCDDADATVVPGSACDDGDACTSGTTCTAGVCGGGSNSCCTGTCGGGCGGTDNCCVEACSGGGCNSCASGCSCDFTCGGVTDCSTDCEIGSTCNMVADTFDNIETNCNGGTCTLDCRNSSGRCRLDCHDDGDCELTCGSVDTCRMDCPGSAVCLLECNNANTCKLNDCASPTDCGDGVWTCNRACP